MNIFLTADMILIRQLINRSEKDALLIDPNEAISQINNLIDFEELKKNKKRIQCASIWMVKTQLIWQKN